MTEVIAAMQPVVEEGRRSRSELLPQLRQLLADDAYRARRHREQASRWTTAQKLAVALTGFGVLAIQIAALVIAVHGGR